MRKEFQAKIISVRPAAHRLYELELKLNKNIPKFRPGQFCMISTGDSSRILRRPFSIFSQTAPRTILLLFRITGAGTQALTSLKAGEELSAVLPLGNGFPSIKIKGKNLYIASGGAGYASVHCLENLNTEKTFLFYGARSKNEVYRKHRTKGVKTVIATDDGTENFHGTANDALIIQLKKDIKKIPAKKMVVCSCGPSAMLKDLYKKVQTLSPDISCYFSLEERMACGVGVCMGCVTRINGNLKRTCFDGPVFSADQIDWE